MTKRTFNDILLEAKELAKLEYSENNIPDLISFIKEAIKIAQAEDPDPNTNTCLKKLITTQKKELDLAKEKDISYEERQAYFEEALAYFKADLGDCIDQLK